MHQAQDELLIIGKSITSDDLIIFDIDINSDSPILKGHFPGQPVVPGACMLQLVKDALEIALKSNVQLKQAAQLKFLRPVIPKNNLALQLNINYKLSENGDYTLQANIMNASALCFKFQGIFKVVP
jgi:3-hydroxyacyl-[acyl-carrier-protein] dehydratase